MPGWERVRFLGQVPRAEIVKAMDGARVGIVLNHPRPNYLEAWSTKMFEYMARGLPVVCSNFPLWAEIVGGADCGIAVDPRDPAAIADAIRRLNEDPALARRLGENGRRAVAERYNWEAESSSSRRCTAGSRDAAGRGAGRVRARASLRPRRRPRRPARARLDAARGGSPRRPHQPGRRPRRPVRAPPRRALRDPDRGLADAGLDAVRPRARRAPRPLRRARGDAGPGDPRRRRVRQCLLHAHALRGARRRRPRPVRPLPGRRVGGRPRGLPRRAGRRRLGGALWTALQRTWPRLRRGRARSRSSSPTTSTIRWRRSITGRATSRANFGGDLVRRRDPRLAARRARSLLRRPRSRSEQHLRLPHGRQRAPRATQRLLLPRPPRRRTRATAPICSRTPGCARSSATSRRRGHEVGLHPSFCTYRDAARTQRGAARLLRVAEAEGVRQDEWGGRQHFLRWTNPDTWRNWEAAGLDYDSTLAYARSSGFGPGRATPSASSTSGAPRPATCASGRSRSWT